jgi:hypothetical protein
VSAVSTTTTTAADRLQAMQGGCDLGEALAFYDDLPAIAVADALGPWRGQGFATGHVLDGVLESVGWYGKRFESAESVHPLVFRRPGAGTVSVNPALTPLAPALKLAGLLRRPAVGGALARLAPLLVTRGPRGRLRMVEHRGVVSTAMVYDALPVIDCFRAVDDQTLLGIMDMRGMDRPFFFVLRRDG